ncbi:MAG: hypothetical protein JXB04_04145 [Kiritimatiellae bacterium]|nr:hypothetical protein [Kiritimatiellia bacterium]
MIVVSIIGVMALIAIPTWTAARNRSFREVCGHNQRLIFEQMNIYCLERNRACDLTTFPDMAAVKEALCPAEGSRYVKRTNAFGCPANPDQVTQLDYSFVRDGNAIEDVSCDILEDHNGE